MKLLCQLALLWFGLACGSAWAQKPLPKIAPISNVGPPQIHAPRAVGATPGRAFRLLIGATGDGPLIYSARDLPTGLRIDAMTGIISGAVKYASQTRVQLEVSGPRGVATRQMVIIAGPHQLAQTPPMGWNSWNAYGCGVTQTRVQAAAEELVKTGLARRGYQFVNVDDCWQGARNSDGELRPNAKFSDMKALGAAIHQKGLKFGIYSSPGPRTCADYEGSYGHEFQDARTYASWGVDYLKYDYCSYDSVRKTVGQKGIIEPFALMRQALDVSGRDIVYSISQYGRSEEWTWASLPPVSADLWRTSRDVKGNYGSVSSVGFAQDGLGQWAWPGYWNDPDMLYLHKLSPDAQITQMTLWSLLAAPLLIGSDIAQLSPFTLDMLSNSEVIEVDQDPLGIAARRISREGDAEVWARPLWDGTIAVGLFNRGRTARIVFARWNKLGLRGEQRVRDLWRQQYLGQALGLGVTVQPRGAVLLKIGTPNAREWTPIWWPKRDKAR